MNLVPTSCNSTDSRVKIVEGVPSITFTTPDPPSQEAVTETNSTATEGQEQVAESPQSPEETWQALPSSTRHKLWTHGASPPRYDHTWQKPPPPQTLTWQPATPPDEQLWSASTSSPPHDMWKTSSPPHRQNHLWSPASDSYESWSAIPTNTQNTDNDTYHLPITVPQEQFWHQTPAITSLSYSGDIASHDPGQVWSIGFDDPTANWVPTAADHLDVLHGTVYQRPMMSSRLFENERRYGKGVGV